MRKKHKKTCGNLNYFENSLLFISAVTGCALISAFASLVSISIGITNSTIGLKISAITTGIKKHKSIIKRKRKKHDKILLLGKAKILSKP